MLKEEGKDFYVYCSCSSETRWTVSCVLQTAQINLTVTAC